MPKPLRVCSVPGCPSVAVSGGRCAEHQLVKRRHDDRPSSRERGYTREWELIRAEFLRMFPVCEWCGNDAQMVDHITPLSQGGTHDRDNLRSLCFRCHNRRHKARDYGLL